MLRNLHHLLADNGKTIGYLFLHLPSAREQAPIRAETMWTLRRQSFAPLRIMEKVAGRS